MADPLKTDKTSFDLAAFIIPGQATDSGLNFFEVLVQVNYKLDQCSHQQNPSSAMPVSLLGLANELLLSIAESLDSERSINAIARTNRRLYLLLNDYLYKYNVIKGESSALWWAAKCGQSGSAAKSISQAGNINVRWDGFLKMGRFEYLASDGEEWVVDLLKRNRCSYCTPIYLAVLSGHERVADLLLQNGADIESSLGPWANPLQAAAQCGQLLAVRQLSALGSTRSDIDKPAPYKGRTALHFACLEGNDMIVQHLIEAGANVMARDDELDTPLHLALNDRRASQFSSRCLRTVQWLMISGANTHARNRKGRTPISMGMQINSSDIGCLFKKGSRIAVYEAGFQGRQPGCRSPSLQALWTAYLDKQTEIAIEASRVKRIATAQEESANQRLQLQQNREAKRRFAENQKQAKEKAREEREERAKALREQEEERQGIKASLTQKQDALRRTWLDLRAKAECVNQPTDSVAKGGSVSCKHVALTWQRRKGKVDCAFCSEAFAKCLFFQCPDCGTSVCQSCTRSSKVLG
jgi:hypothetical protein